MGYLSILSTWDFQKLGITPHLEISTKRMLVSHRPDLHRDCSSLWHCPDLTADPVKDFLLFVVRTFLPFGEALQLL